MKDIFGVISTDEPSSTSCRCLRRRPREEAREQVGSISGRVFFQVQCVWVIMVV